MVKHDKPSEFVSTCMDGTLVIPAHAQPYCVVCYHPDEKDVGVGAMHTQSTRWGMNLCLDVCVFTVHMHLAFWTSVIALAGRAEFNPYSHVHPDVLRKKEDSIASTLASLACVVIVVSCVSVVQLQVYSTSTVC